MLLYILSWYYAALFFVLKESVAFKFVLESRWY